MAALDPDDRTPRHVPITEEETAALMERVPVGGSASIPLAWGVSGVAIDVTGDGSAAWALRELAAIRGAGTPSE